MLPLRKPVKLTKILRFPLQERETYMTTLNTHFKRTLLGKAVIGSILALTLAPANAAAADKPNKGKFYGDFRLRYETVEQNNPLEDADALTLRSRVGYKTAAYEGFSALIEIEDVRELVDDFSVPPAGVRPGQFSVIADPEGTEVDQAFVQYANEKLSLKVGRQVFTLDGHRFIGHVGWRQDRQTFDGAVLSYKPAKGFSINASYIDKRNRIFSDERDVDSKDVILNTSFATSAGKITAYAYLLEEDTAASNSIDTFGVSFTGSTPVGDQKIHYAAEVATQEINDTFDTNYLLLEGGLTFGKGASAITAKLGYEELGSDDGMRGFATPLATLHKFNGWADQFLGTPGQGLQDIYASLTGKAFGGKWVAAYHDFSSDTSLEGADDLGDEINLLYARKITDSFAGGIKFADYSAGDTAFGKVDAQKTWLWLSYKF